MLNLVKLHPKQMQACTYIGSHIKQSFPAASLIAFQEHSGGLALFRRCCPLGGSPVLGVRGG